MTEFTGLLHRHIVPTLKLTPKGQPMGVVPKGSTGWMLKTGDKHVMVDVAGCQSMAQSNEQKNVTVQGYTRMDGTTEVIVAQRIEAAAASS